MAILEEESLFPKATDRTLEEKLKANHLGKSPNFVKAITKADKNAHFAIGENNFFKLYFTDFIRHYSPCCGNFNNSIPFHVGIVSTYNCNAGLRGFLRCFELSGAKLTYKFEKSV